MNILWIPHAPWSSLEGQREWHFIKRLRHEHAVHVITWERNNCLPRCSLLRPDIHWRSLRQWACEADGITLHHIRRCFDPSRLITRDDSKILPLNQMFLRSSVRRIVRTHRIDVVVGGVSQYAVGYPPFDLSVPFVFDYMDQYRFASPYLAHAAAVCCISESLLKEAQAYTSSSYYVPNGVDAIRFATASGRQVREELRLDGYTVVSLIGLTCSPDPFFVDAIADIQARGERVKALVVGEGPRLVGIKKRAQELAVDAIFTGWVDHVRVQDYFAASDVGLYPGEKNAYYDGAVPLKLLEYTAAKRPVVATDLVELRRLAFPNVFLAAPNKTEFAAKLSAAIIEDHTFPDLTPFDWDDLSRCLIDILRGVIS